MVQVAARMLLVMALALLVGCTTSKGSFCALSDPDRPSAATIATMTDAEVKKSLAKNELGARLCGWKP